jgi:hypothetical protein
MNLANFLDCHAIEHPEHTVLCFEGHACLS